MATVIVVGTDPHLIRACADRDLRIIVVRDVRAHMRGGDPLPESAVEVVVASIADIGDVWAGLMRIGSGLLPSDLAGVVTTNEFAVAIVSALASMLHLPGIPLETSVLMRDKYLQKQAVRRAGLPTAEARVIVAGSDNHVLAYPGPCVLKPLAGTATVSTTAVRTESAYRSAIERLAMSSTSPLVVESLVDRAEEMCVDGVVQDGAIIFSSVARYSESFLSYTTGSDPMRIYRMDGTGQDDTCAEARALAMKALEALTLHDGVFHLELLRESGTGTLYFGECAARRGGAMIQEQVMVKHGFSLASAAVDIALGEPVRSCGRLNERHVGTTFLYLPRGIIVRLPHASHLERPDYVHDVYTSAKPGMHDPAPVRTGSDRDGMCVVSADSAEELETNMASIRAAFVEQSLVAPAFGAPA